MKTSRFAFALVALATTILACNSRDRGSDPTGMPSADGGAADVDAGGEVDAGPADAGPDIPAELLAICMRVGPGYAQACDVEAEHITIAEGTPRPPYEALFPGIDAFNMNGWEWWQQWPGGASPTFESEEATDEAMRCSVASALRFAAIMQDPPEDIVRLLDETTWEGRFFNWNDDFSQPAADGDGTGPVLWAWEWYLIKWISQTNNDGSCYLPTRSLLEEAAATCLGHAALNDGVIQGCSAD